MSGQLATYRNEIFNFLRTVTIKFEPFAWLMGESYMDKYGITSPHGAWNPYYIHLSGEYTPEELKNPNSLIHVWTVEKEAPDDIIFDKNTINTNPKTAALYRIPNEEYSILEERYPNYVGLIRTIAYPIASITEAINAPNLSLLAYDASLLEENERESIITCLKDFLKYVRERWYVEEYTYENMYAVTFWAMLWQMLPIVLLDQRIRNIKKPSVHSFHIWEYLTSKGLADYRDVLTKNQSLWLYRNINYIRKNQGKEKTLKILANNLLGDAFVSLLYKDLKQNTAGYESKLVSTPEFVSYSYDKNILEKIEQVEDLNSRLYQQKIEYQNTTDYQLALEEKLGHVPYSTLNTKFLEFKKDSVDTSGERFMTNMYIDTVIYMLSEHKLSFNVAITESSAGISTKLFVGDALNLMCWCALRSAGILPTKMFKYYMCSRALRLTKPLLTDLRDHVFYNGNSYNMKYLTDTKTMINSIGWIEKAFVTQSSFADWLSDRYKTLSILLRHNDVSNKYLYHQAMRSLWEDLSIVKLIELDNSGFETWIAWYTSINQDIATIIRIYEGLTEQARIESYKRLASICFDAIFGTEESVDGATNVKRIEKIYTSIRDLFIQLCSYNITYLEADREVSDYIRFRDPDFVMQLKTVYNYDSFFNLINQNLIFNHKDIIDIGAKNFEFDNHLVRTNNDVTIKDKRNFGFDIHKKYKTVKNENLIVENDISQKTNTIHLNFKINIGNTTKFSLPK